MCCRFVRRHILRGSFPDSPLPCHKLLSSFGACSSASDKTLSKTAWGNVERIQDAGRPDAMSRDVKCPVSGIFSVL